MTKKQAYKAGRERGIAAVKNTDFKFGTDESLVSAAFESEENSRQYADFANGVGYLMNNAPEERQEELWDAYGEGVASGVYWQVRQLTKEYREKCDVCREMLRTKQFDIGEVIAYHNCDIRLSNFDVGKAVLMCCILDFVNGIRRRRNY